ncbi:tRNA 2-thiouridine(34) synthase MnmA [uncultured Rhodospira sp.]|uniref:tRNA 2-thiouridine(34) synthase MnmA n=1 Tax=uncultured Rhodospira sp. TaxID=1936189 RepID=UPI00261133E3|nr:tRNA 2-thiouridine(34) synthase MnmA [uncultured Rhodospira sp.]
MPSDTDLNAALDGLAPGRGRRAVVAMSGGVDSSVTAGLLAEAGYDVVGLTMQLTDHGQVVPGGRTCCAGQDIHDARRVADRLGLPHYVVDYESTFRRDVMDPFADSYVRGETPVPCVLCNQTVKFRDLLAAARDLGADVLATGHYVRWRDTEGGPGLWRARDAAKDQSYFLFATTREQLETLRFPLGGLDKTRTRALAARYGLAVHDKPESQDICFVPDGDYARVVERLRPGALEPGEIVDTAGRVLGRHDGVIHYTVGQRRGLGIGGTAEPLYVVRLEPESRRVVVGPRAALGRDRFTLRAVNWLGPGAAMPPDGVRATVKIRNTFAPVPATIAPRDDGRAAVTLDAPADGVSPGQACVLYDGDRVLGGGWIERG